MVCDNLATHKTPLIQEWLARHPRFCLHFTPTGSSWINLAVMRSVKLSSRWRVSSLM
jgi:hypothetical protein